MFGEIDTEDAILAPLFLIGAGVSSGFLSLTAGNFDLASGINVGGTQVLTYGFVLAVVAMVAAYLSNQTDLSKMEDVEIAVVGVTLVLLASIELVPMMADLVGSHWIIGGLVVFVEAAGFYAVSYLG